MNADVGARLRPAEDETTWDVDVHLFSLPCLPILRNLAHRLHFRRWHLSPPQRFAGR